MPKTVNKLIETLPKLNFPKLVAPKYTGTRVGKIALAVESMKRHTTDEGWQIMQGLEENDYILCGHNLLINTTDVNEILDITNPGIVLVQDKREWDIRPGNFREKEAQFRNIETLRNKDDLFKLTILKDSHQNPNYHRQSAEEIGCHAWIIYYHPKIVHRLAPYIRPEHLIKTYHSLDPQIIPPFRAKEMRIGCLLSGASSNAYPLRKKLIAAYQTLPSVTYLKHPGYHRNGCCTPKYLDKLNRYRVAICTSSCFGYALRKIMEATACGCHVITDLPTDEVLPEIDENLHRVSANIPIPHLKKLLLHLYANYNQEKQIELAQKAMDFYSYHNVCKRLANDIENLRQNYNSGEDK